MYVGWKIPPMRGLNDPHLEIHVVMGDGADAGKTKCVKFHSNLMSPLLQCTWVERNHKRVELSDVDLMPALKRQGWRLLQEMFEEEGDSGRARWQEYLRYQAIGQSGRTRKDFPEQLLPKKVLEMRAKAKGHYDEYVPSPELLEAVAGEVEVAQKETRRAKA